MIRSIFLDIDGTLVSFATHQIPASTVDALTQAKARGVGIYISTGRPLPIINNLGAISHLIDGYITTNGALCFVGDEIVYCNPIPQQDVDAIMADMSAHGYACLAVGERSVVLLNRDEVFDEVFIHQLNVSIDRVSLCAADLDGQRMLQFSPFIDAEHERWLMEHMPNSISGRWHPAFTDITSAQADKGVGLAKMAEHLGLHISQTMAFGDGGNDISIIRRAGIGVAMGNAGDDVKREADYVTTDVDHDGIANALRHFSVI